MYGHVPQYLDVERERLRAEREKSLAKYWRLAAGMAALLAVVFLAMLTLAEARIANLREFAQQAADETHLYRQRAAEASNNFERCKVANAGLVESLQDFDVTIKAQKQLIGEAIDLAKRCESRGAIWASRDDH